MYVCFRCELRQFRGCVECHQAVAAVMAVTTTSLHISLPNPLSHHLRQIEGTHYVVRELYRDNIYGIYINISGNGL